ncbi:MAG: hypothetical protein R3B99_09890 [Polyangiales bacterium]
MIGWLVKDFFGASPMLALPKIALIIFLVVFVVVTIRTFLLKKSDVDARAHLVLEGEGTSFDTLSFQGASANPSVKAVSTEKHHG